MVTLRIEHEVTDFDVWLGAFARFASLREQAGVRDARVMRPSDGRNYVMVDLDFDGVAQAEAFREILRTRIWAIPENSPALAGEPQTAILERIPT